MLKTLVKLVCLLPILVLTLLSLMPSEAYADANSPPSGQKLIKITYFPLMIGNIENAVPLVKVKINQTTEATFLFDTGSATSIISDALAKKLGMKLEPAVADNGEPISIFTKKMLMGSVSSLAVGDVANIQVTYTNQLLLVVEDKTLNHDSLTREIGSLTHIDGVIGSNLLERTAILINVQDHTLQLLYPGNFSSSQLKQLDMASPSTTPVAREKLVSAWYTTLKFNNGKNAGEDRLKIDTGSGLTVIHGDIAKQLHLKAESYDRTVTYNGLAVMDVAYVASTQIGDLIVPNLPVEYQSNDHIISVPVLGMNAFRGYRVLMDFPAKKMYLQPNAATPLTITMKPQTPTVPVENARH